MEIKEKKEGKLMTKRKWWWKKEKVKSSKV